MILGADWVSSFKLPCLKQNYLINYGALRPYGAPKLEVETFETLRSTEYPRIIRKTSDVPHTLQ